uniref:Uncharacterized protein n=1 Tax=Leersia perrieri TaxID=77586 RepID=A0A0D9W5L1_9ORYZ
MGLLIRYRGKEDGASSSVIPRGCGASSSVMHQFSDKCLPSRGVRGAYELGISNIILETDALMVKQGGLSNDYALSCMGGLLWELKYLLSTHFNSYMHMN